MYCLISSQALLTKLETHTNSILDRLGRFAVEEFLKYVERDYELFYEINVYKLLWGYPDHVLRLLMDFGLTDNDTFSLEVTLNACL